MVYRRNNEWERDSQVYSEEQVEAVANYCDIDIVSDTATHLLAYCPFHSNTDTPAFALDKEKGLWTCFNPSCDNYGNLEGLLRRLKGLNYFEATRVILKYKDSNARPLTERLAAIRQEVPDFVQFPVEPVERMHKDLFGNDGLLPLSYLVKDRGIYKETLKHFGVGYSVKKDMSVVPMHDPDGMLVGFIGRSIQGKEFKNSSKLPKSKTAWNFHRAKRFGDTVIIVESSFDAMRVHQAGYPNVIALLGGHLSAYHVEQITRTFSKVIIMTDYEPDLRFEKGSCAKCRREGFGECQGHRDGRALGREIVEKLSSRKIFWAAYDDSCVYPHRAKDAGDMTDDEIRACLRNAVSNFEYVKWGVENTKEALAL